MMRRGWHYLLLGVAAWLLFLLWRFPAAVAYDLASESLGPQLRLAGLSGTLWHGRAEQLQYGNQPLGEVEWRLSASGLLVGRVWADLNLRQDDGYLQGEVALPLPLSAAEAEFTGVRGRLPLQLLQPYLKQLPPILNGELSLKLGELALSGDGRLQRASGRLVWHQAGVSAPQPLEFGDLVMELENAAEGGITGRLSDNGGPLQLQAQLSLDPQGRYRLQGRVQAAPGAPAELRQSLGMLGRADAEGGYPLNFSGNL